MRNENVIRGMRVVAVPAALLVAAAAMVACGGGAGAGFPDAPDETVRYVAEQLGDQHPEVLWEAMPASYREDVTELVHRYAEKTDPEVYDKGFQLARKTVTILDEKKDIILGSSVFTSAMSERGDEIREQWDTMVGVLETIVESDLSSLDAMQTIDIEAFLADTGAELMRQAEEADAEAYSEKFESQLDQMQVETVSLDGDTAVLKITVPDEEPEEVKLVRVEERWVPQELADQWEQSMAEARESLSQLDEEKAAQTKMQAMMMMGMAEGFLDQVAAVESSEELDSLLKGMFGGASPAPFQQ